MSKSKHIAALIIIAVVSLAVILVLQNPNLLSDIWLWIIGLIGPIIGFVREGIRTLKGGVNEEDKKEKKAVLQEHSKEVSDGQPAIISDLEKKIARLEKKLSEQNPSQPNTPQNKFSGTTLTVLRYQDDGETTLGLLFINNLFFCYTLEDTFRAIKIAEKTRIPNGTYEVDFNRFDTPLTLKYRQTRSWFTYHLEIKNVPDYIGVYIHSGGTHEHTAGCLLVSNGLMATDKQKILNNSRDTYESLYKLLAKKIDHGEEIRIRIENENWFEKYINSSI